MKTQRAQIAALKVDGHRTKEPLRECVRDALEHYFRQLDGHDTTDLYDLVLSQVEAPMLETVLAYTDGNQTRASEILGMSRGTLRKKLRHYGVE